MQQYARGTEARFDGGLGQAQVRRLRHAVLVGVGVGVAVLVGVAVGDGVGKGTWTRYDTVPLTAPGLSVPRFQVTMPWSKEPTLGGSIDPGTNSVPIGMALVMVTLASG